MTKEEFTRTAHGTPIGTSEEEEGLRKDGLLPEADVEPAQYSTKEGEHPVPPRHGQGAPANEQEIPLSEKAGEGRVDRSTGGAQDAKQALRESMERD